MTAVCNKIKSIVAFAVICVILSLPLDAFASGDSDFVYYIKNGKVCVSGYRGVSDTILVPEKIKGKTVAAIDDYAFSSNGTVAYPIPSPQSAKTLFPTARLCHMSASARI